MKICDNGQVRREGRYVKQARTRVEKYPEKGKKLYVAVMDLEKAYDGAQRNAL